LKLLHDFGVRALFGTLIILPSILTLCWLAINGSSESLVLIGELAGIVIGFYFGQRSTAKKEGDSDVANK
jgi:hypothetical protein